MSKEKIPKQIIVIRKDLKMRRGKEVAQGAHASVACVLQEMGGRNSKPFKEWISGKYTKVCVQVNSEEELLDVYNSAIQNGINAALITDAGLTEFNGVPTKTCAAIGPDYPSVLDPVTGQLPLY